MKVNLSRVITNLEGVALLRKDLDEKLSDKPLTLSFALGHVLSKAVEDLGAYEQAAGQCEGAAIAPAEKQDPQALRDQAAAYRNEARRQKIRRGELALLLADDAPEVDLAADDIQLILRVCTPRLAPVVMVQLDKVLN